MMRVFIKDHCPYSAAVLDKLAELNVPFEKLNIKDPAVADELVRLGGKRQVPCMFDGDVELYESTDIVKYLDKVYGASA